MTSALDVLMDGLKEPGEPLVSELERWRTAANVLYNSTAVGKKMQMLRLIERRVQGG